MNMSFKKHSFKSRLRAFRIWQKLGVLPWTKSGKRSGGNRRFSKGAFDSIPFLNDDAKRTFVHLLFRPGYMIRDYIKGDNERFLAPLTSLIIFYAFFAMLVSIVKPDYRVKTGTKPEVEFSVQLDSMEAAIGDTQRSKKVIAVFRFVENNKHIFSLDKHPEAVNSPAKASLAALESSLRSQGVYLFLGNFLMLWLAMYFSLKRRGMGLSASAAAAAYILCQFCFFMLFFLIITLGGKGKIGIWLMALLIVYDYRQLFGVGWKKSLRLATGTGLAYAAIYVLSYMLLAATVVLIATLST